MIESQTQMVVAEVSVSVTCDVCKKKYLYDDSADAMEIQEFHLIKFTGGYGSIFGDGNPISCDICQHCLKEKLGEFLKQVEDDKNAG